MRKGYIVSLSGGKDSTAMLHWMLEKKEPIEAVLFFDTEWEFPEMYEHLDLIEKNTGIKITRVKSAKSFHHWMYKQRIIARKGPHKGKVHKIGSGWPHSSTRWCTREKISTMQKYTRKHYPDTIHCVGIAINECERIKIQRYPLIEWNKTEADCLQYCKSLGYHWGGLYDIFNRVSCWCCPLRGLGNLRLLRKHRPQLWQELIEMDLIQPRHNPGYDHGFTVLELEERFNQEK